MINIEDNEYAIVYRMKSRSITLMEKIFYQMQLENSALFWYDTS